MGESDTDIGVQWEVVFRIAVVGLVCIGYVAVWARVGELSRESRRLDRLIASESLRQGELARQRAEVCNPAELEKLAPTLDMVKAPVNGRVVAVGALPAPDAGGTRVAAGVSAAAGAGTLSAGGQTPTQAGIVTYSFGQ